MLEGFLLFFFCLKPSIAVNEGWYQINENTYGCDGSNCGEFDWSAVGGGYGGSGGGGGGGTASDIVARQRPKTSAATCASKSNKPSNKNTYFYLYEMWVLISIFG